MDACPRVSRTNSPQNSWIHCSKKWEKIEDSKVRAVVFKIWHTHTHTHISWSTTYGWPLHGYRFWPSNICKVSLLHLYILKTSHIFESITKE
jgi:hypothetical protein